MPENLSCPDGAGAPGPVPLLAAKLAAAPLPEPVLVRPRLLARLDSAVAGPVTLVRAPAGWGKTTLLASWFRGGPAQRSATWLSVGPADGVGRLWPYLYAALATAVPGEPAGAPAPGSGVPGALAPATGPPDQDTVERLAAALAGRAEPVVLICDDLHLAADPAALTAVEFLLRHADDRLRLVVGARTDPPLALHRFRVSGELTEIRAADLAFTDDEVADLLSAHGAVVPPAAVAVLRERTEGWPVGLRLAALALRGHPDPASFVARFSGEHPEVTDYLTAEVLAGLPDGLRGVLDCVAVTEPVTGDLVTALTGRDGADQLLAELEQRIGFLTAAGDRPPAYRCHRLLADVLRAALANRPDDRVRDLHRRAADWYAGVNQPRDALRYTLAAARWADAARLLLDHWPALLPYDRDEPDRPPVAAPPEEQIRDHPAVALAYAVDRLGLAGEPTVDGYLCVADEAAGALPEPDRTRLRCAAAGLALIRAQAGADPQRARGAADRLLQLAPPDVAAPPGPAVRAVARTALGLTELGAGQLAAATDALAAGLVEAGPAGLPRVAVVAASRLALIAALRGELRAAETLAAGVLTGPPCQGRPAGPDCGYAYLALALVATHRDRPVEAETQLALAERSTTDGSGPDRAVFTVCAARCHSQLLADRGDPVRAYQVLAAARDRLGDPADGPGNWLLAAEAELRAGQGDLDRARELLASRAAGSTLVAVVLARVELCAGNPDAAGRVLPDWDGPTAGRLPVAVRAEAGLLDALLAQQSGDPRRAARLLERALDLAEPDGLRRFLVRGVPPVRDLLVAHLDTGTAHWPTLTELLDHGDRPQATGTGAAAAGPVRLGGGTAGGPAPLGEPLTERELTILRYLQSVLSNVEIASELSVSVNTVKTHVRNIYRKLDATRRRDAVRRARELHLL
ncbi:LuxR C-terminal-related transcriptional regulator [Micromonospora sp. CPCC 206060]|uniref:LuxR C-terminal-related transcriptional regulator n=1 Tax=Micromonospora sp. CPCC 206060 TaxID=3122406 RepID=UPI002FF12D75